MDNRGQRSVRYEGSPQVVARLAGSHAVTAAFAFVRGEPPGEATPARRNFALPTGGDFRVVRQVDPITSDAIGRAYWLGAEWNGAPPRFAA